MPRFVTKEILTYVALGFVALVVRVWELDRHILLIDEAFVGVAARDIAFNNTSMWDAVSNAPYVWGLAQLIGFIHDSPFVLRLPSALAGVLSCLLLYWFVRRKIGQPEGLFAAVLFALHPFAIAFTRVTFVDALQLPMLLLAIFSVDCYFEKEKNRKWVMIAVASAMAAFIFKYNALAVLVCWFSSAILLKRYTIGKGVIVASALGIASLLTLLFWPFDATVWFFSFLAKGGSYDRGYIWDFYHYAYRHVTFGSVTFFIALAAHVLTRRSYSEPQRKLLDHFILFSLAYFALLLYLGRPFQRYLLLLTVPVAIVYAASLIQGWKSLRVRSGSPFLAWSRAAVFLTLAVGIVLQGYHSSRGYAKYLTNDLPLTSAVTGLPANDSTRFFWPTISTSIAGYYLGFDQYYSMSTRGPINKVEMSRHYFLGSTQPYSADTLPYSVLIAKQELRDRGFFQSVFNPGDFLQSVRAKDAELDRMRATTVPVNYYTSDLLREGDLLIETRGTVDQNGEPMLYVIEDTVRQSDPLPEGFEFVRAYVGDQVYTSLPYTTAIGRGEVRILRKANAAR